MIHRYFDGALPAATAHTEADLQVARVAAEAVAKADQAIDDLAIHEAIAATWTLVDELNNYITVQEPWALAKDEANRERLATVLNTAAEGIRVLTILLAPVTPKACATLWAALGSQSLGQLADQKLSQAAHWGQLKAGSAILPLEPLFPRIETEAK